MRRLFIAAVVCAFITVPAMADFTVTETGNSPSLAATASFYTPSQIYSGLSQITVSGDGALNGSYNAFCIDVGELAKNLSNYNATALADAPIPGASMGAVKAGKVAFLLDTYWSSSLDATSASALQNAIWEVINESAANSYDLATGDLRVTGGDATALFEEIAKHTDAYFSTYSAAGYLALVSQGSQDFVIKVPLPGAVLLGVLGLIAAGRKLRKLA